MHDEEPYKEYLAPEQHLQLGYKGQTLSKQRDLSQGSSFGPPITLTLNAQLLIISPSSPFECTTRMYLPVTTTLPTFKSNVSFREGRVPGPRR